MKKYLAVLGRQAEISLAELESLFGSVRQVGPEVAVFEADGVKMARLGGCLKVAEEVPMKPVDFLLGLPEGKITLGVSDYTKGGSARKSMGEALKYKRVLVRAERSVRIIPNSEAALSTAAAHHNQLAEKKNCIELIRFGQTWWRTVGVQNISAYARRDQARPARDARVGMLPPKLAQILINLCGPLPTGARILDPFCGTGVVLQEAVLMGYAAYGSDIEARMVDYSQKNLSWLLTGVRKDRSAQQNSDKNAEKVTVEVGDATEHQWSQPVDAVACECYLGRPMSQPPAEIKLKEEKMTCSGIILGFLRNLGGQVKSGTPVVIAVPAWLRPDGAYSSLSIIDEIEKMGYNVVKNRFARRLLYHREGQVVAREIIVLRKK